MKKTEVIDCIKADYKDRGLAEKWVDRLERCQTELAEYQVVCDCRARRPPYSCTLPSLCPICAKKRLRKVTDGLNRVFHKYPLWKERKGRGLSTVTFTQESQKSHKHGVFLLKKSIKHLS